VVFVAERTIFKAAWKILSNILLLYLFNDFTIVELAVLNLVDLCSTNHFLN